MTGPEHILWEQEKIGNDFLVKSYSSFLSVLYLSAQAHLGLVMEDWKEKEDDFFKKEQDWLSPQHLLS